MLIKFKKFHASGNDFVFIEQDIVFTTNQIQFLCNRNYGIGCDQLIMINKITNNIDICEHFIEIYNQDGSNAKMCGNAMLCLASYLKNNQTTTIYIKNGASVNIKRMRNIAQIEMPDAKIIGNMINIGNLHKVFIINDKSQIDEKSSDEYNKNYVEITGENEVFITTVERGSGKTLACGSGICATCYYLYQTGVVRSNIIKVKTNGTEIAKRFGINDKISVEISENIKLTGSWNFVFSGKIEI